MKKSKLKCKHCGNTEEFYTKERYKGICECYFRADGKETENGHLYETAEHSLRSKYVFCGECNSKVCKVEALEE